MIDTVQTPHPDTIERTENGPRAQNYAFGLRVRESNGEVMIGHTGGWVAFASYYYRFPALELSTIVFCNSAELSAESLGARVAGLAVTSAKGM